MVSVFKNYSLIGMGLMIVDSELEKVDTVRITGCMYNYDNRTNEETN